MTATKFITFAIGCLLLAPFIWSFVVMLQPAEEPTPEMKRLLEEERAKMVAEMSVDPEQAKFVTGWTTVTTHRLITPHPKLANVWAMAPRRWVGIMGLAACLVLVGCVFVSSFFPVVIDSFGYGHGHQPPDKLELGSWNNDDDGKPGKGD